MNFFKNPLRVRHLLLFFVIGLTTATLSAQTISQKTSETEETEKAIAADELTNKNETPNDKTEKDGEAAKSAKQAEPKPPRFGGHVGIVIPIVTRGDNKTTTIGDDFIIGFPFALTVRTDSPVAFDFEFIPIINTPSNQDFRFLVHPGIVYSFKKHYAAGVRAAYEFGTGSYGFTPIVNRSFKLKGKTNYFIEADFPVRRERRPDHSRFASIGFAVHSGINF